MDHSDNHESTISLKLALDPTNHSIKDYAPLFIVFVFIAASSATHVFLMGNTLINWSMASMGYFFLFFALFKFIDLPGFKEGYTHYDFIAQRVPAWGYVYPFVELALGLLYLLNFQSPTLYFLTILITIINVISVSIKLVKKEKFMCACLGTILKVPLTTVTLIEYGLMGFMAGALLIA